MTDRELLELAAKACGRYCNNPNYMDGLFETWQPLDDDGYALRLMAQLGMQVSIDTKNRIVFCNGEEIHYDESKFGGDCDPMPVLCRAIVRAAAEIGKAMK